MNKSAALPIEEIEHGLYWMIQTNLPDAQALRVRYYGKTLHFIENNNSVAIQDVDIDVLRFIPIMEHNVGRPGTGSGPGGAVTPCDEHYELGEQ